MDKTRFLRYYLWIFGFLNVFVISFTVPLLFGDIFLWHPRNIPDEMMISVIYLTMGIVMIFSASNPVAHKSFLDFVIIANILHAGVMLIYARNVYHVVIDVTSVGAMGILPLFFYPWRIKNFLKYNESAFNIALIRPYGR